MGKILVIDNTQVELEIATGFAKEIGVEIVVSNPSNSSGWRVLIENEDITGVVSDLFWQCSRKDKVEHPAGLLVAIVALSLRKPVAICTSAFRVDKKEGHHGKKMCWIFDGLHVDVSNPLFGWFDGKEWSEAIAWVEKRQRR